MYIYHSERANVRLSVFASKKKAPKQATWDLTIQNCQVCCSVLQCFAVCCSVLQCVTVCCSVLQCVALCCSVLQYVAVCCSVL